MTKHKGSEKHFGIKNPPFCMKAILNSRFPFKDAYLCMKQCCVKKLQPFCAALHIHKCMFLCIVFRHRGVRCDKKKTIELHCFRILAAWLADWS